MPTRTLRRAALAAAALLAVACSDVADPTRPATAVRGTTTPLTGVAVRINEIESNLGAPGDWVELHNASDAAVDVSGWYFTDDNVTRTFRIAAGTVIPARGYLVLEEAQFGFGLGAADQARLLNADSVLVDSHAWADHAATTWARCPDGTGAFALASVVTKGSANDCAPFARINEIESQGGIPGDWIEFFNPNPQPVDLSGHVVRDNDDANRYVFPAGTTIPAGGYLVLEEAQFGFGIGAPDAVRLFRPNGTVPIDSHTWNDHAPTTLGRCPDGAGTFIVTATPTKGTANACAAPSLVLKINEVESNGGDPDDWVELVNTGGERVDVSGYVFRDNNDGGGYVIPAGTTIPAGGYLVLEVAQFGFGLGGEDAARLFAPGGTQVVDSYSWTTHAGTTYGRCPDGTGAFTETSAPTKGARNDCTPPPTFDPWPGDAAVAGADPSPNYFGGNMSGLVFENRPDVRSGVLWAVKNGPGTLYRLFAGTPARPAPGEWANGKAIRYPNGTGDVDAEGVTFAAGAIYVAAERNNAANSVSRNSILRYDPEQPGTVLTATREWNLTADIPATGPNLGLEAITFVPDAYLVANGFIDESRNAPYSPANYPNGAGGIFLVGVEATGLVYAYSLDHVSGGFTRVATIRSGFLQVMELTFDAELQQLWAVCDNGCQGRSTIQRIVAGRFAIVARYERPAGMPNLNNEGFAVAPQRTCVNGRKAAWWTDDGNTGSLALRSGTVTCSPAGGAPNPVLARWP